LIDVAGWSPGQRFPTFVGMTTLAGMDEPLARFDLRFVTDQFD
jgi:hypothetical protein